MRYLASSRNFSIHCMMPSRIMESPCNRTLMKSLEARNPTQPQLNLRSTTVDQQNPAMICVFYGTRISSFKVYRIPEIGVPYMLQGCRILVIRIPLKRDPIFWKLPYTLRLQACTFNVCNPRFWVPNTFIMGHIPWLLGTQTHGCKP